MYSPHNEGKSVIAEKFIETLKTKISKKMTAMIANLILRDQSNNTYHHSINKKPINADYPDLTEKTETNLKAPNFKVKLSNYAHQKGIRSCLRL